MLTLSANALGKTLVFVLLTFGLFHTAYAAGKLSQYDPIDVKHGNNMSKICKTIVGNPNEYHRSTIKLLRFIRGKWRVVPKSQYNLIFPGDRVLVLKSRKIEAQGQFGQKSGPTHQISVDAPASNGNPIIPTNTPVVLTNDNTGSGSINSNIHATNSFNVSNSNVNQVKSDDGGEPPSEVVAQIEAVSNYRLAILSFILITLGLLSFIFVKVVYPWIISLWQKRENNSDVKHNQNLKELAEYLNREALENFELDLETSEDANRRSFHASEENGKLHVLVTGFEQSSVHGFLEAAFVGLNLTAENKGLRIGPNEQLRYKSEWDVTATPQNYKLPDANLKTLFARREHMRAAGKKIAVKLLEPYEPGTITTDFIIDARTGLMSIVFTPTGTKNDFYGSKDTPNEYFADAKSIVEKLTTGKRSTSSMDRFSFVDYCRNPETQISTVKIRLKLVEEKKDVTSSNSRS